MSIEKIITLKPETEEAISEVNGQVRRMGLRLGWSSRRIEIHGWEELSDEQISSSEVVLAFTKTITIKGETTCGHEVLATCVFHKVHFELHEDHSEWPREWSEHATEYEVSITTRKGKKLYSTWRIDSW